MKMSFASMKRNGGLLLGLALAVTVLSVPARASFVNGQINESGVATITTSSLTFCNSSTEVAGQCPGTAGSTSWVVPASASGSFCMTTSSSCTSPTGIFDYQNDTVMMTDLNSTNAPVGTLLPGNGIPFVTFNATAGLPSPPIELFISELFGGQGNNANCTTGVGECTPTGGSVTLINTGANTSTASISGMGYAESETGQFDPMSIVFTAQFGVNMQTLFAQFQSVGEITTSYSGTFTASSVPEPTTPLLMGLGLVALAFTLRQTRRRKTS
jgi:hypothetical protein